MRLSILTVDTFCTGVLSQGALDAIPKCARSCFTGSTGDCSAADLACTCGNNKVIDGILCCVYAACSQKDIDETTELAYQMCKLQKIEVNTKPSCPSGTAMPSALSSTASVTGMGVGTNGIGRASATGSTAAAPAQTAGAGLGLGIAVAGLLAVL